MFAMDIKPPKRVKIIALTKTTEMSIKETVNAVGFGKYSVSRIVSIIDSKKTIDVIKKEIASYGVNVDASAERGRRMFF